MKQIYVFLVAMICLTLSFDAHAQCDYQLELTDFFGNDWGTGANLTAGAGVDVTVDGVTTTYLIVTGSGGTGNVVTESYAITVNDMSTLDIDYRSPAFEGDGQFRFVDSEGLLVFESPIGQVSTMDIYTGAASCPTCPVVSNIVSSIVTADSAEISWTVGGSEVAWEVEYGVSPYTVGTGGVIDPAPSNPFTIDGLSSITTYDVYVRAVCVAGTDVSNSVGPITFTTTESCPSPGVFAPGTASANEVQFAWDANGNPSANYEINYGPAPFNQGDAGGVTVPGFFGSFAIVDGLMSDTTYDFYVRYDCGNGDFSLWSGPYTATTAISCPEISGLQATATVSTLDVSWAPGGTEMEWEVDYATAGVITSPGTGQGIPVMGTTQATATLNLTALPSASAYDVYVRAICDAATNDLSQWVNATFVTLPDAPQGVTCPNNDSAFAWDDDFEDIATDWTGDVGTGTTNGDWNFGRNGTTSSASTGPSGAQVGSGYVYYEISGNNTAPAVAISPAIDLTNATDEAELSFYFHSFGVDATTIDVAVGTSPTGPFTSVFSYIGQLQTSEADPFVLVGVALPSSVLGSATVYIQLTGTEDPTNQGGFTGDVAIDLMRIETCGAFCSNPDMLAVTNVTTSSVDITFNDTNGTAAGAYEYVVQAPDTGIPTVAGTSATSTTITDSTLMPATTYEVYVRSTCGGTAGASDWVGPVIFSSACVPFTAPYTTDYESDALDELFVCDSFIANGTGTGTPPSVIVDNFVSASGNNHINMSSGSAGDVAELFYILPEFSDLSSDKRVRFNVNDRDSGGLEVGTMTDPSDVSTFNSIQTFVDADLADDVYEEKIVYFNSLTTTGGFIAFKFNPNDTFDDMFIDDVNYEINPSCIAPVNFQSPLSTTTTADLTWDDSFAQAGYEVEYGVLGHVQGDAVTLINNVTGITTTTTQLTGLSSATFYSAYVRTVCGAMDESVWVGPITISTECDVFGIPFFETFDSTSGSEQCWTVIDENADGDEWDLDNTANVFSGDQSAMMDTDFNGGDNDDYLISPAIVLTGNERLIYQYRVRSSNEPDDFEVLLSTTTPDIAGLTNVILPQATYSNTNYVQQVIDLTAYTGTVYLSWHVPATIGQDGWEIFIDDVLVETIPTCMNVSAITADMLTDVSANINWTENEMATAWEYEYGPSLFTQGSGIGGVQMSTDNTMNAISGLSAATSYDVYVRSVCVSGGFSNWIGPISFTTLPGAPQGVSCPNNDSAFAWEETFDDNSAGWTGDVGSGTTGGDWNFGTTGATGSTGTGPNGPEEGSGYLYFETSGTTGVGSIVSPAIDLTIATDEAELSFYVHSFGGDPTELEIAVSTVATGPFTPVFAFTGQIQANQADPFSLVGAMLPASVLGSATVYIQITGRDNDGGFAGDIGIDFMRIQTCGAFCSNPDSFAVANLGTTGGDFSFNDSLGTPSGAYEYVIQNVNTGLPTAAGTAISTTMFTDNTLMPATTYEVYYRTICSATSSSDWSGPFVFTTSCVPFTAPYFTDYESDVVGELFVCDNGIVDNSTAGTPFVEVDDIIPNSGSNHIILNSNSDNAAGLYYVMPEFSDLDATKRVRFFAYDRDNGGLEVGVMSDPNDVSTFSVVQTFLDADLTDDQYVEQTVNFTSITTVGGHIAFRFVQSGTFDSMYLDDINYEEIPSCPNPTALTVNVVGDDNLDLSWNLGNTETEWIVEYATPDFATGTAIPVNGVMSNTNYILNGLTPSTPYEVRVFAVCNPMDVSPAANSISTITFPSAPQGVSCTTGAPGFIWEDSFDSITTTWTGDVGTGTTSGDWNFGRVGSTGSGGTGPSGSFDGAGYLYFETSGNNVGPASIVSPPIDLTTGANDELELSFYIHSFGGDQTIFDVAYGTSVTGPFTSVYSFVGQLQANETDSYAPVGAMLPSSLIGQTIYIQITGTEEVGSENNFQGDFAVDFMRIQTCGTFCSTPSGVNISAIGGDTVTVDWTENGSATTWEVAVVNSGTGVPTTNGTSTNNNPYTENNLSPQTVYEVYVRADCGNGFYSDWTVVETFTTSCVPFVAPYGGAVAGVAGNDFTVFPGVCWEEGDNTSIAAGPNGFNGDWATDDFGNDTTSTLGSAAKVNIFDNGGDGAWLVTPEFELGRSGHTFAATFDVALTDFFDTTASNFGSDDQVDFLITTDAGVTWTVIDTYDATDNIPPTAQTETVSLTAYSGIVRFAFRSSNGTVDDGADIDFFVDNFTIDGTAGVNDMNELLFSFYPNPTTDVVNFIGQQDIDVINVKNLLGQQIITLTPSSSNISVDLSSYPTGMYLIEVTSGVQSRTVKVLKK